MKAYNKAVLAAEEFIPNTDIADGSESESTTRKVSSQGEPPVIIDSVGVEFEIGLNGNDEI